MGRHRLPCDDTVLAVKREKARERMARKASQRRADAEATAPRVTGTIVFAPVTCPRCGDVFRGSHPLHSYSKHRAAALCPWFDEAEKAAHKAMVRIRNIALATHHTRLTREGVQIVIEPLPALHTGHELFDRARAARHYWPRPGIFKSWPIWEDMMSEAVLALLEDRDAAEAIREFVRKEPPQMLSLDGPAPWAPEHKLLDVLAA